MASMTENKEVAKNTPMACTGWLSCHYIVNTYSIKCCEDCHAMPANNLVHFRQINQRQYRVCCTWKNTCLKDLQQFITVKQELQNY